MIYFGVFVALCLLAASIWFIRSIRKRAYLPLDYTTEPSSTRVLLLKADFSPKINRETPTLDEQSVDWRGAMTKVGQDLRYSGVQTLVYVHGTFVGKDPWGVLDTIKQVYPEIPSELASKVQLMIKLNSNRMLKDTGNFLPEYVELADASLGAGVDVVNFTWSSGNHHAARLKGAINLIGEMAQLAERRDFRVQDRILCIGHSHGGQVFALVAAMLYQPGLARSLSFLAKSFLPDESKDLGRSLSLARRPSWDFVTLGTPPMYSWPSNGPFGLLHIVNHRRNDQRAGSLKGLLHTKDGDYVQQFGVAGSDLLAASASERELNRELAKLLGGGADLKLWSKNVRNKMRVIPQGTTLLVDYQDSSTVLPNCVSSFFGHGCYTKYEAMLFNLRSTLHHLYGMI